MDPLTSALLIAGSTKLFNALIDGDGDGVGRKDVADVAAALFEAFLKVPKQDETLSRIEAKVDRSLRQDFNRSYGMGVDHLGDAVHDLNPEHQENALRAARQSFKEAARGTESRGLKVQSLYAAAGCSLLLRNPAMARQELDQAWQDAFSLMKGAAHLWDNPTSNQRPGPISDFLFNTAANQKLRSRAEIEEEVSPLRAIVGDIGNMRHALGSPQHENPILEIPAPGHNLRPLRIMSRFDGSGSYSPFEVQLPDGSSARIFDMDLPTRTNNRFRAIASVTWAADEVPGAAMNPVTAREWHEERYPLENWRGSEHLDISFRLDPPNELRFDLLVIEFMAPPLIKSGPPLHLVKIGFSAESLMGVGGGNDYGW